MGKYPVYAKQFRAFSVQKAICCIDGIKIDVLLESRQNAREEETLFTIINGQEYRAPSIHELVYAIPKLEYLSIDHSVRLTYDGKFKTVNLVEIFTPQEPAKRPTWALLQVKLIVDDAVYITELCDTLTDAIWELDEMIDQMPNWWLCNCYHCRYSGHARFYNVGDRMYWCYRDAPEAHREIETKGKQASQEAFFSGAYHVDAFHMCDAWQPLIGRKNSDQEKSGPSYGRRGHR